MHSVLSFQLFLSSVFNIIFCFIFLWNHGTIFATFRLIGVFLIISESRRKGLLFVLAYVCSMCVCLQQLQVTEPELPLGKKADFVSREHGWHTALANSD